MKELTSLIKNKVLLTFIILIAINGYITVIILRQLEDDKVYINLLNRQTMIIQKFAKDVQVSSKIDNSQQRNAAINIFDTTYKALVEGGKVSSDLTFETTFDIKKIKYAEVVKALELVDKQWQALKDISKTLSSKGDISFEKFAVQGDKLAVIMNNTTLLFQSVAGNSFSNLILLQLLIVLLAFILFVYLLIFLKRIKLDNSFLRSRIGEVTEATSEVTGQIQSDHNNMVELTEEKDHLQALLTQVGNIALLGNVTSGIPYELNNPITVLAGYADELDEMVDSNNINENLLHSFVHKIKKSATQIRNIIDHASLYCRDQEKLERELKNPKEIIDEALYLMERQLKNENVEIRINIKPNLPQFWVNSVKIGSILQNIIRFSCESFKKQDEPVDKKIEILVHVTDSNKYIAIEMTDNGGVIPDEEISQVFEPLYGIGNGSSYIGLSVTKEIITHHRGKIAVQNIENNKKSFTIKLPVDVRDERRKR